MGAGYFAGQRWGETQGDPNGMRYGLIGGFAVWALFLWSRRRRLGRGGTGYNHHDDSDGGSWSDDDGGDDGGGDDGD